MRPPFYPVLGLALVLLTGCVGTPAGALKLDPQSDAQRQLQTRRYAGAPETALLTAGLGVLQDLGFTLDGSESKLGVLSASRRLTSRRPLNGGEIMKDLTWMVVWLPLGAAVTAIDAAKGVKEPQFVRVSLVTRAEGTKTATVRITAQRLVYKDEQLTNLLKVEPLDDPAFYQEFFTRLSKSVFLEEQKI